MIIYDISQNIFEAKIYPGDPKPTKKIINSIKKKDQSNLSSFRMCSHIETHVDAPSHFLENGMTIEEISLEKFIGFTYVFETNELIDKSVVNEICNKIKDTNIDLIRTELLTFGSDEEEQEIHKLLLGSNIVLLEGINLKEEEK